MAPDTIERLKASA